MTNKMSVSILFTKNAKKRILLEDLLIKTSKGQFIIPAGFETDLASIPRIFRWVVSPTDWFILVPAIFHDWVLREKLFTRKTADYLFLEKMRDFGGGAGRFLPFLAVRAWSKFIKKGKL